MKETSETSFKIKLQVLDCSEKTSYQRISPIVLTIHNSLYL